MTAPQSKLINAATEAEIDLGYITLRGKFWGPEDGQPTIALHGYLDNANSFDMTAPYLPELRIFALDFAGHGWSGARREAEQYTGHSFVRDVLAVADHLGWQRFNILGHSMGAEIGSQLAGLFPDRVNLLMCLDGFCGVNTVDNILEHQRTNITASFKKDSKLKVFPDFDAMIARLSDATGQNATSSLCLIERGHKEVEGGYTWATDPRMRGSGPNELLPEHYQYHLDQIAAETLIIVADRQNEWLKRILIQLEKRSDEHFEITDLPGHHHIHMQERAPEVVELLRSFIARKSLT